MKAQPTEHSPVERRRGRPRSGEREDREQAILDAALAELVVSGYEGTSTLAIARRAGASKETLYSWFGGKEAIYEALIQRNADASADRLTAMTEVVGDPAETLTAYAIGLLNLLTSDGSVALNRAAMSNPGLATTLLTSGRHRVGPIVERYLARLDADGTLSIPDPADAFQWLYGLVVRDTQIRVLLGDPVPDQIALEAHARSAVATFIDMFVPTSD